MRLSLLLRREPFGAILERTLSRFWTETLGAPFTVRWGDASAGAQVWRGNSYLNFFCVDDVDRRCFEVIRNEYSYSRRPWLRPLQRAYVGIAVTRPVRRRGRRLCFSVTPPVPDAAEQLLIPGNHRLRLLHPRRGEVRVLHKDGFAVAPFRSELAARRGPAQSVAPPLLDVDSEERWFTEGYFVGTPANRLPAALQSETRRQGSAMLARGVHAPTRRRVSCGRYVEALGDWIVNRSPSAAAFVAQVVALLAQRYHGEELVMVRSHGDFQDGNVLLGPGGELRIIDWEFSGERSELYDFATLQSGIRLAHDWIDCWREHARAWTAQPSMLRAALPDAPTIGWLAALVWLLEEAQLRTEQPHMRPDTEGLDALQPHIAGLGAAVGDMAVSGPKTSN